MRISQESFDRVQTALDDIIAGCEVEDDFNEWEDVASSSVSAVLEELNEDQTEMTCAAFRRYITNSVRTSRNLALGVRAALIRALEETLDYLDDSDDEYVNTLKSELELTKNMEVCV